MSSKTVRDAIKNYLSSTHPTENIIDITEEIEDLQDLIEGAGLVYQEDAWLGIDFIGFDEYPIDVLATNTTGKYREEGVLMIYVVEAVNKQDVMNPRDRILVRAENILNSLRGKRLNGVVIERLTTPNFQAGSNLQFEGNYVSAMLSATFHFDKIL